LPDSFAVYRASLQDGVLHQGEIISNLIQVVGVLSSLGTDVEKAEPITHRYAIVVSQDCDLTQDFEARNKGTSHHKRLHDILFCEVEEADIARHANLDSKASDRDKARSENMQKKADWNKIKQNTDFRFQYLRNVEPSADALSVGVPHLIVDFNRTFSIPRDEVYKRFELRSATRRAVLQSPYLEHLAVRFHHFHCRIALPLDHDSNLEEITSAENTRVDDGNT
jgi:hypothetical protein